MGPADGASYICYALFMESPRPSLISRFNIFDPRGRLTQRGFAIVLLLCSAFGLAGWSISGSGASGSWIALVFYVAAIWAFLASTFRRMNDAGISRMWLLAPLAASAMVFAAGFYLYQPEPMVANPSPLMKFLAVILVVPALLAGITWLLAKVIAGFLAAFVVWIAFGLTLLAPATKPPDTV